MWDLILKKMLVQSRKNFRGTEPRGKKFSHVLHGLPAMMSMNVEESPGDTRMTKTPWSMGSTKVNLVYYDLLARREGT